LKNPELFFKEKDYYDRLLFDVLKIPENLVISTNNGEIEGFCNNIIPDIISVLLQFRHALMIPVIHKPAAINLLADIVSDTSNGVNDLLDGFD